MRQSIQKILQTAQQKRLLVMTYAWCFYLLHMTYVSNFYHHVANDFDFVFFTPKKITFNNKLC